MAERELLWMDVEQEEEGSGKGSRVWNKPIFHLWWAVLLKCDIQEQEKRAMLIIR